MTRSIRMIGKMPYSILIGNYVKRKKLTNFLQSLPIPQKDIDAMIAQAIDLIKDQVRQAQSTHS